MIDLDPLIRAMNAKKGGGAMRTYVMTGENVDPTYTDEWTDKS